MAAIKDLLRQIPDTTLRERLSDEINRLSKNKKFGLKRPEKVAGESVDKNKPTFRYATSD